MSLTPPYQIEVETQGRLVTTADLADDSVTSAKIAVDAVGSSEIAANAVGSSELADGAVDTNALQDDSVTALKIAANAVGSSELADNAVDTNAIQDDAVTSAKIATDAVGSAEILAGAVGDSELAAAIPRGRLADVALTANSSLVSAETDLSGFTIAPTVGTSRCIVVTVKGMVNRTVADGTTTVFLKEGATYLDQVNVQPNVANESCSFHLETVLRPSSGAHTYKASILRNTGTGTTQLIANAAFPATMRADDDGAA